MVILTTLIKKTALFGCLALMVLMSACSAGGSPTRAAPTATQPPAPTPTQPPTATATAQPATATKPPATATPRRVFGIFTPTGTAAAGTPAATAGAAAGLISPQTADGLKSVAQFIQDEPASQWLWSSDGKLVVLTVKGYYHYDLAALKASGFTSSSFAEQVIATSPDGALAVAMQKDGSLQIWDLAATKVKQTLQPVDTSMGAAFSPDGKTLAVTSADNIAVTLWDVASGQQTATLKGFETAAPTYRVQFSPDGRSLVWIARATAQFMVIASSTMGSRLSFEDFINTLVFAPDGKTVAIADADFVTLRQVSDGAEIQHLGMASPALSLAYSPDGKLLAIAVGKEIEIRNSLNGQLLAALKGHTSMVRAVGFAPDGRSLVSGDEDGNVFVWRVQP